MSSLFPTLMSLSEPIRVGGEFKRAPQWAAQLAPTGPGDITKWKNALLWLEGEQFGSEQELVAKVHRILDYLENERGGPPPTEVELEPPEIEVEVPSKSPVIGGPPPVVVVHLQPPVDDGFVTVKTRVKKATEEPRPRWSVDQLAAAIVQESLVIFGRTFTFAGPSLDISSVYARFDKTEFTAGALLNAVNDVLYALPSPYTRFGAAPKSARYRAAGGAGKGKNFNVKVQRKDQTAPGGYSAIAQVHVLWQ